jgi:diaminohydroxyphosphoribosylaminopyrimidine deaminase/5-amino-6-(5-phosphoribosylamino)uracil reductase
MAEEDNVKFMRRCLELASKAEGLTYPNPMVGAVIVHKGIIIGEGYHLRAGGPHAEVLSIQSVRDRTLLRDSSLYVNLEPCSHFGRTPPCADLIVSLSIPRVVIGTTDPSDKVSGKGVERMRKAGCEVTAGILGEECRRLNRRFFTFHEKKRPYITLKWAESADGFIDVIRGKEHGPGPNWISGKPERALVHKWRSEEQAILVGGETVRTDNPKLNVRDWTGNDPLKLVLSGSGSISPDSSVVKGDGKTVVFTYNRKVAFPVTETVLLDENIPSCRQVADYLYVNEIQSLLIEGGAKVIGHFIENGMWDEARVFRGKSFFGGGVPAPVLGTRPSSTVTFSSSVLDIFLNS